MVSLSFVPYFLLQMQQQQLQLQQQQLQQQQLQLQLQQQQQQQLHMQQQVAVPAQQLTPQLMVEQVVQQVSFTFSPQNAAFLEI